MRYFVTILLILSLIEPVWTQVSPLQQRVTLTLTQERIDNALTMISRQGGFSFSYNPTEIEVSRRVNIVVQNKSVREILDEIFKGEVRYKERGRHLILQKITAKPIKPTYLLVSGYVFDQQSGKRLAKVSIFDKRTLTSAITDSSGLFKLKISSDFPQARLEIRKGGYAGSSIVVRQGEAMRIPLVALTMGEIRTVTAVGPSKISAKDSLKVLPPLPVMIASTDTVTPIQPRRPKIDWRRAEQTFVDAFASAKQAIHIQNVADTLYRPAQISLLPFVGTNHVMSGNVINGISLNLIAGYSLGVTALEVGGFANLIRRDVQGVQLSGFANLVGRNVSGIQLGGFANAVMRDVNGIQGAGFINVTGGHLRGLQLSGFANLTGGNVENSLQAAGYTNVALGHVQGMQLSGFANVAARRLHGAQISSFFNYAHTHKRGLQIALFNYADSSGALPIGLVSYVRRNGYRRLEIGTDEMNYGNLIFKTGVAKLYNIIAMGGSFGVTNKPLYTAGYGLGTSQRWGKGWRSNVDFTFNRIMEAQNFFDSPNGLFYRLNFSVEKRIMGRVALYAGPAWTWLTAQPNYLMRDVSRIYQPLPTKTLRNGLELTNWIGFQSGVRIVSLDY